MPVPEGVGAGGSTGPTVGGTMQGAGITILSTEALAVIQQVDSFKKMFLYPTNFVG